MDEVQKMLENFKKLLKDSLDKSLSVFVEMLKGLDKIQNGTGTILAEKVQSAMQKVTNDAVKTIDCAILYANKTGKDVSECTNNTIADLKNIPNIGKQLVLDFVNNKTMEAKEIVNQAIDFGKNFADTLIKNLTKEATDCANSGWTQIITCGSKLVAEITKAITSAPSQLNNIVVNTQTQISKLPEEFKIFADNLQKNMIEAVQNVTISTYNCIKNKLGENPPGCNLPVVYK